VLLAQRDVLTRRGDSLVFRGMSNLRGLYKRVSYGKEEKQFTLWGWGWEVGEEERGETCFRECGVPVVVISR